MDITLFNWIIALLPIVLLIVLLAIFKWTAGRAAGLTLVVALVTSAVCFKAGGTLILFEALKGLWNTGTVLFIIFPAILLYEVIYEAGCIDAVNSSIEKVSPHQLFKILTVGWVFAGFLQSITGFGVPVAICVPILIGLGVKPAMSVVIALIGQSWGNTFGTLAVAWDMLVDISGIEGETIIETAMYSSILLWILNLAGGLMICWLYGRLEGLKQGLLFVLTVSLLHGGGEFLVSQVNTSIAAFVPATLAVAAVFGLARLGIYKKGYTKEDSLIMKAPEAGEASPKDKANVSTVLALSPYMVLIVITILALVIEPINQLLSRWSIGFAFPETETGYGFVNEASSKYSPFYPLVDSGTVLLVTCIISYIILSSQKLYQKGSAKRILKKTLNKVKPTAVSIALLLIISKLMSGTGQTLLIAQGITLALGINYVVLSGIIGLMGSFITGSNMSSNILFTDVQVNAALNLGVESTSLLAAQTSGAAVGSIISPSKIVLGTTAAGAPGKEGEILKTLLPLAIVVTVIIGFVCRIVI